MNVCYTFAKQQFLSGQINWIGQTFRVLLVDTDHYGAVPGVDRHLADIPIAARIATSGPFAHPSALNGVALADDVTVNAVAGPVIRAIVIFHDTGNDNTAELICYVDTGIGLPWNPQGGNVVIHWDRGPNGIFRL